MQQRYDDNVSPLNDLADQQMAQYIADSVKQNDLFTFTIEIITLEIPLRYRFWFSLILESFTKEAFANVVVSIIPLARVLHIR